MKKVRRILALVLVLVSLAAIMSITASAVYTPEKQVVYYQGNGGDNMVRIEVGDLKKGESIKAGSIKSSNSKVLAPSSSSYYLWSNMEANGKVAYEGGSYTIKMQAKKAGTAKVTYTIGKKTYATTVTVKKYTNPIKSMTIAGVKSGKNLSSAFKKTSVASTKLTANGKKGNIVVQAASGWKVSGVGFASEATQQDRYYYYGPKGVSKATVPLPGALKKSGHYAVWVEMRNTKDGEFIYLSYEIGK